MKRMKIYLLIGAFFLVLILSLHKWDYREVSLSLIGSASVEPALPEIVDDNVMNYIKEGKGVWLHAKGGDNLKRIIVEWLQQFKGKKQIRINWGQVKLKESETYYACIGCRINSIKYFYHSRYTNVANDKSKYAAHSISFMPIADQNVITIYNGDVVTADIGSGFPCD